MEEIFYSLLISLGVVSLFTLSMKKRGKIQISPEFIIGFIVATVTFWFFTSLHMFFLPKWYTSVLFLIDAVIQNVLIGVTGGFFGGEFFNKRWKGYVSGSIWITTLVGVLREGLRHLSSFPIPIVSRRASVIFWLQTFLGGSLTPYLYSKLTPNLRRPIAYILSFCTIALLVTAVTISIRIITFT